MARRVAAAAARGDPALAALERDLRAVARPHRAEGEKAYLKSDLEFWGTTVPDVRRIAVDYFRAHPDLGRTDLRDISVAAFETDVFDLRSVAIALVAHRPATKLLEDRDLPWLLDLVNASKTWAHVDWIAAVIADVIDRYPTARRWLPVWARHKNFWIRRTALLAQLAPLRRGHGDWPLFARLAASMLHEKEFFIRKAIGWVLRDTSHKRPKLVYEFLRAHRGEVSGLTLREGAKYLSRTQRRALGLAPSRVREVKALRG